MMWVKYGSFSPGGNVCSVHLTRENGEKWGLECVFYFHTGSSIRIWRAISAHIWPKNFNFRGTI